MKHFIICLFAYASIMGAGSAFAADTSGGGTPAKATFAVAFTIGPNWDAEKPATAQAYFKEHSANLMKLRQEKKILLGGRYADTGLIFVAAHSADEAKQLFEKDPSIANGTFKLAVHQFHVFFKGAVE